MIGAAESSERLCVNEDNLKRENFISTAIN